ncbi:MAG: hypothetical protein QXX13_01985 [Candidatus Methanomethylicia archaeon]
MCLLPAVDGWICLLGMGITQQPSGGLRDGARCLEQILNALISKVYSTGKP